MITGMPKDRFSVVKQSATSSLNFSCLVNATPTCLSTSPQLVTRVNPNFIVGGGESFATRLSFLDVVQAFCKSVLPFP